MKTHRAIFSLMRFRPALLALTILCWILFYGAPLLVGLLLQTTVDRILGQADIETDVATLLTGFGGLGLLNILIIAAATWTWFSMELSLCGLMRRNLLEWLMTGPGSRRLPDTSGESLSRLRDDVREVALYFEHHVDLIGTTLFTLVALTIMAGISPLLTAVVLLPLGGVVLLVSRLSVLIRRLRKRRRETTGRVTGFIGECFSSVQSIKAACAEHHMSAVFQALNNIRRKAAVKDQLLSEFLMSVHYLMFNLTLGLLLCFVGTRISEGTFTIGNLVLFIAYLPRLSQAISMFGRALAQHRRTGVSIERMERLAAGAPDGHIFRPAPLHLNDRFPDVPTLGTADAEPFQALEVKNLSSHYPGSGRGISGVGFRVERGEILAVTGRIASGKSTLLKTLLGLMPKDEGEVLWNGEPVEDPASFLTPPRCAYTPQVPWLFSDQLRYNILLGEPGRPHQLEEAVQLSMLEPDIEHLEEGLDTRVGPRGHKLSGGQIQRSSAARMFVREPSVLIMDDLSSALDVQTEQALWKALQKEGRTCIMATHRKVALRMANRILVLKDGRPEDSGTLDELLSRCPEMQVLWAEERQ